MASKVRSKARIAPARKPISVDRLLGEILERLERGGLTPAIRAGFVSKIRETQAGKITAQPKDSPLKRLGYRLGKDVVKIPPMVRPGHPVAKYGMAGFRFVPGHTDAGKPCFVCRRPLSFGRLATADSGNGQAFKLCHIGCAKVWQDRHPVPAMVKSKKAEIICTMPFLCDDHSIPAVITKSARAGLRAIASGLDWSPRCMVPSPARCYHGFASGVCDRCDSPNITLAAESVVKAINGFFKGLLKACQQYQASIERDRESASVLEARNSQAPIGTRKRPTRAEEQASARELERINSDMIEADDRELGVMD